MIRINWNANCDKTLHQDLEIKKEVPKQYDSM